LLWLCCSRGLREGVDGGESWLGGIIKKTELQMDAIRHAPVHAWYGKEVKQKEEDLLKSALLSQQKDAHTRFHSSEQEAAVDKDHGHISPKLMHLAKEAKALEDHDARKEESFSASGENKRNQHLAEDLNHGKVSKKQLNLAVKLAHEMHKEGDVARQETWEGGADKKMKEAAEDKDHGKITKGMLKIFEQAMDEQQHNGPMLVRKDAKESGSAKVLLAAERERQKDTMLSMQHERN